MTTGGKIKEIRKQKKISQQILGKSLGVSQTMIAQYEKGDRLPKIGTLRRIAEALEVPLYALLDWNQYTTEDFKEDMGSTIKSSISKIPEQFPSAIKEALKTSVNNLDEISVDLQRQTQKALDEDWRGSLLLSHFSKLNSTGRNEAVKRVSELSEIKKYTESEKDTE